MIEDPFPDLMVTQFERTLTRSVRRQQQRASKELDQLVAATYQLIRRSRGADPQIRDILKESGLSSQAFYRLFRSKDELMLVLLDEAIRWLAERVSTDLDAHEGGARDARAWLRSVVRWCLRPATVDYTRALLPAFSRLQYEQPVECAELLAIALKPLAIDSPPHAPHEGIDDTQASLADIACGCIRRGLRRDRPPTSELLDRVSELVRADFEKVPPRSESPAVTDTGEQLV